MTTLFLYECSPPVGHHPEYLKHVAISSASRYENVVCIVPSSWRTASESLHVGSQFKFEWCFYDPDESHPDQYSFINRETLFLCMNSFAEPCQSDLYVLYSDPLIPSLFLLILSWSLRDRLTIFQHHYSFLVSPIHHPLYFIKGLLKLIAINSYCLLRAKAVFHFSFVKAFCLNSEVLPYPPSSSLSSHSCYDDSNQFARIKFLKTEGIPILLCIGSFRADKGFDIAVRSTNLLKSQVCLVIAGPPSCFTKPELLRLRSDNSKSVLYVFDKFLSNDEYSTLASLADIFLLPYSHTFCGESGPLVDSRSLGKISVISNAVGLRLSIKQARGSSFTSSSLSPIDFSFAIDKALSHLEYTRVTRNLSMRKCI